MPKGFRTLIGPKPEWAREFGLVEHSSHAYPPRTFANVRHSDITIRIAVDFESAGEIITKKAIEQYGRRWADVDLRLIGTSFIVDDDRLWAIGIRIADLASELDYRDGITVNFAGNSESTAPGIETFAEDVVRSIIKYSM